MGSWGDWGGDWSDWSGDWSDWGSDWASDWGSDWQGDWSDLWLPFGLDAIWFRLPSAPGLGGSLATPPAAHPENVQTKSFGFDSFAVAAFSALDAIGSSLLGLASNQQAKPSPPTHQQIESGSENELVKRTKEEGYVTAPIFEAAANFNRWWQKEVVDKHFYTGTPKTPLEHFAAFGTGAVRSVGSTVEFFGTAPPAFEYLARNPEKIAGVPAYIPVVMQQMYDYAKQHPAEFAGETAGSIILTWGAAKGIKLGMRGVIGGGRAVTSAISERFPAVAERVGQAVERTSETISKVVPKRQEVVKGARIEEIEVSPSMGPMTEQKLIRAAGDKTLIDIAESGSGRKIIRRVTLKTEKRWVIGDKGEKLTELPEKTYTPARVHKTIIESGPRGKRIVRSEGLGRAELRMSKRPQFSSNDELSMYLNPKKEVPTTPEEVSSALDDLASDVGKIPNVEAEIIATPVEIRTGAIIRRILRAFGGVTMDTLRIAGEGYYEVLEKPNVRYLSFSRRIKTTDVEFMPELFPVEEVKTVKLPLLDKLGLRKAREAVMPSERDLYNKMIEEKLSDPENVKDLLKLLKEIGELYREEEEKFTGRITTYGTRFEGRGGVSRKPANPDIELIERVEEITDVEPLKDYPVLKEEPLTDIIRSKFRFEVPEIPVFAPGKGRGKQGERPKPKQDEDEAILPLFRPFEETGEEQKEKQKQDEDEETIPALLPREMLGEPEPEIPMPKNPPFGGLDLPTPDVPFILPPFDFGGRKRPDWWKYREIVNPIPDPYEVLTGEKPGKARKKSGKRKKKRKGGKKDAIERAVEIWEDFTRL